MRADLAARVANAVRSHLFGTVEVAPVGGSWRKVSGDVRCDWVETDMDMVSTFGGASDALHLMAADYAPATMQARPTKEWWVRYSDATGQVRYRRLALALKTKDSAGQFLWGPLKDPDPDAVPPP